MVFAADEDEAEADLTADAIFFLPTLAKLAGLTLRGCRCYESNAKVCSGHEIFPFSLGLFVQMCSD